MSDEAVLPVRVSETTGGLSMSEVTVYSAPWCPHCKRVKRFLAAHRMRYDQVDIEHDPAGRDRLAAMQDGGRTIPMVVFADGSWSVNPSDEVLARRLGLTLEAEREAYDLVIVGGGPAGLAAGIYAAREGIDAIIVDGSALGGQAATTGVIDNYPGFPDGISGGELADRFITQARRYGVELLPAVSVNGLRSEDDDVVTSLATGAELTSHAVIVAPGSTYRRLDVPGEDELIGSGVHFCATCDGPLYRGAEELVVIGGGNSALEEGLHLSEFAERVRILQRGERLTASQLLQDRVKGDPHFSVHTGIDVTGLARPNALLEIEARDRRSGEALRFTPAAAFVFIGLQPNTSFLHGALQLDAGGFLLTDDTMQTSLAGVFAAGDARAGSTKQLGSAVGDGIAALLAVRRHLQRHAHLAPVVVEA